jgi:hypothetical protein
MIKIFLLLFIFSTATFASSADTLVFAFWNVENLFDTADDPLKNDDEFLPDSEKEWTEERLDKKMFNLARVIRLMNDGNPPHLLGVCEVEHQHLLDTLISRFLNGTNLKTAYMESPDNRGIDNGLIYDSSIFDLLEVRGDTVHLFDKYPTRLILYVSLLTKRSDTLHIFVNHWPSRRGGEAESEKNRIAAAEVLRTSVDSIFSVNPLAKIIIMGDFNDEPSNRSVFESLNAHPVFCDSIAFGTEFNIENEIFNLSFQKYSEGEGSYKFRDHWNMLDQIIVSGSLFFDDTISYVCGSFEVFKPEVMVTRTGQFAGTPFPTFGGRRYLGGYSDHFPVLAKFLYKGGE